MSATTPPLDQAPPAVKLAVDLIMLLEQHQLDPAVVLAALPIVTKDFQRKLQIQQQAQQ
ncbi:pleiotropic regulatory protein RsmS [Rheinheimera texasensis]|uniref:pleiotropic regulatory protein RsmS n=1 Tax=Rheinheimera texasensis TaxID=306205 RepID=UPI0032B13078